MYPLRGLCVSLLTVAALLAFGAVVRAQQDGDVTVIVKAKSKPAVLSTLLVLCDLPCEWKLDGEVKGHIDAGGSVKVKVEAGEHMVDATTEDGADEVKHPTTVKPTGQAMANIELQPVRDARLLAESEAAYSAAQAAEASAGRESKDDADRKARQAEAQEREAKEEAERQPWSDSATGLMWTKKDFRVGKGDSSDMGWQQGIDYCKALRLANYADWRLPSIDELRGIHAVCESIRGCLRGNLQPSGWAWSSTQAPGKGGKPSGEAWALDPSSFGTGLYRVPVDGWGYSIGALCVRGPVHQ